MLAKVPNEPIVIDMGTVQPRIDASHNGWYFSPADGGIAHSINAKSFRDGLIFHLLFEPAPLVIMDASFFNCRYLVEHLERSRYPLFLRALEAGLVIPAFRSSSTETFLQCLNDIGGLRILGIEHSWYKSSPSELATRLDRSFDASKGSGPIVWPENMGGAFGDLARRIFIEQGELATEDPMLAAMWHRTEPFRTECLEEAQRVTRQLGGSGIRRAEILNAVGRKLNLLPAGGSFDMVRDLLTSVKQTDGLRPLPLYRDIEFFVDVVNLCYQRSQADKFGCGHNIPGALVHHIVPLLPATRIEVDKKIATFQTIVRLPSFSTLEKADSRDLVAIRGSDPAMQYFHARWAWAEKPSVDREGSLEEAVHEYARILREAAKGPQKSTMIGAVRMISRPGAELAGAVVGSAFGAALGSSVTPGPFGAAVGAALGGSGAFVVKAFQELRPGPHVTTQGHPLQIQSVLRRPDLNIP